jgi:hypothetical protein
MKNIKKILLLTLLSLFIISCSKDSEDDDIPQLFLANHVGDWETTFNDLGVNVAVEITPSKAKSYSKLVSANCYNAAESISGGTTTVEVHSAFEYTAVTKGIPVANVFSGSDLTTLQDLGITSLDIAVSYGSSGGNSISFAEIIYEANTTDEIYSVSGNLGKINALVKC